jgi:hypothetical protein
MAERILIILCSTPTKMPNFMAKISHSLPFHFAIFVLIMHDEFVLWYAVK